MTLRAGKINVLIDGQFGSTGKGVMAGYLARMHYELHKEPINMVITNAGPNSGHTVDYGDGRGKMVSFHIPSSALYNERTLIYLTAGSIIDPVILEQEIKRFGLEDRVYIHPHAAIVTAAHKKSESNDAHAVSKIASTQKGVGSALADKILRKGNIAINDSYTRKFVKDIRLPKYLAMNPEDYILMEVPQGFGLGVNSGLYPYTTSREVSVSQALSDAGCHPEHLGNVIMTLRTYPIRVGNIMKDGEQVGYSGDFYPDSVEVTWEELGQEAEKTTVTGRIRRVATFSHQQYSDAVSVLRPDLVFLNFANYMKPEELNDLIKEMDAVWPVSHVGFGPTVQDVLAKEYI